MNIYQPYMMHLSSYSAPISIVSAVYINSTAVRVTWTPLDLPVVDHYTVHYSSIVNGRRLNDSGSVTFPASVSSGVVSGLLGGQQYQFSVSVTLSVGGHTYTGVSGTPQIVTTEGFVYKVTNNTIMFSVVITCFIT